MSDQKKSPEPDAGDTKNTATEETPSERPQRTPGVADYLRVFTYATKWDMCLYVIASVASIGAGITLPLMNVIFGQLVGQFTDYFKDRSSMTQSDMTQSDFQRILNKQALYIMALFIARWGLNAINKFCFRMIGIRLSSAIRLHYLESIFAQSIYVIDSLPAGAPATAITSTSNTLQVGISERLGTFLEYNGTIWAALVVAFVWSWDLTLVTSSLLVYILVVLSIAVPLIVKGHTANMQADAQGVAIASEALQGIRLVMACGAQSRVICRYQEWVTKAMKAGQKIAPIGGVQLGCVFFGVFGAFGLAFWYGTQRYIAGAIDHAGVVIIVIMSVMMILTSVERISTPLMAISKAMVAACEFLVVIDAPRPVSGSLKPDIESYDVDFDNVTFEYPGRPGVRVLDGLSFRLQSGYNTALVGPSGSGKSTIVALLERWYSLKDYHLLPEVIAAKQPEKKKEEEEEEEKKENEQQPTPITPTLGGTVTVAGHNLEDLDMRWWRTQIGLVQQEPFLFNDTIFNNVANGLIGSEWEHEPEARKREMVQEACEEAYADEFINRLPDVGLRHSSRRRRCQAIRRPETTSSNCEKHHQEAPNHHLDEATSAIDARSERIVQAALDRVTKNRTTVTIAHRLSTIKKADNIIVLQNGRAVEQGTHNSLMQNPSGVYSALVKAQSLKVGDSAEGVSSLESDAEADKVIHDSDVSELLPVIETDEKAVSKKPPGFFYSFRRIFYEQRAQWPLFLGTLFSAMCVASGTPIQAWLTAKVIGVFLLEGEELKREGNFWGLMWFALAGGVGLAYFCEVSLAMRVQYAISASYKAQYLHDMLYQKAAFFDEEANSHGALTSRISGDAKQIEDMFGLNFALMLGAMFNVLGCCILALVFGWKLGLIAMFVALPIMITAGVWKYKQEVHFDEMNSAVFMESSQFATEAIGAIRTVSALTMEDGINKRYRQLLDGHVKVANRRAQWTSVVFGFADSVGLGCQALIFWYGGGLLARGEYTMEAFFARAAANRILQVHTSANVERPGNNQAERDSEGGARIELRNVDFKYPTRDIPVLHSVSLTIEKGQYVAFVGPSGCGKTTIISLVERFYDVEPNCGAILRNGVNVNDLDVYDYRKNLSLVSQEPTMFQGSIRDNILLGVADPSSVSDERIHQVCRDAFIHEFIVSLPEGYNTQVGQKGVSMSGGQKQRIAIARALIRDPEILLLDEATSALDSESEKIVQAAFEKARKGRTMIAVAHRLSTIQEADVIFVFGDGRIIEKGSHAELISKRGVYWDMCQNQALDQ
ncbi:hypothetical protein NM208_g159 [Fusarium decemcellulare]|uniref:Uncharacterized protein n=1 Tax=Fusarium decemcellulare TaxID=57161 RepID=A0ACC1T0T1_9HYPO|nr:hypothetical protein NM208_g159 [Fusarium decemcellulare]